MKSGFLVIPVTVSLLIFSGAEIAGATSSAGELDTMQHTRGEKTPEAFSFFNKPLYKREVGRDTYQANAAKIAKLQQHAVMSEQDYISLGALYAANKDYKAAIRKYSEGLRQYPGSYRLLRHRAHRYLTTRQVVLANTDLVKAERLINESSENPVEYKKGKPNGFYQHWIWYHLGISEILQGNSRDASLAFEKCLQTASNQNQLIGVVDWLYTTYNFDGKPEKADEVLSLVSADTNADPAYPYYKRVMLYKGLMSADDVISLDSQNTSWTAREATLANGVANWLLFQGRNDEAEALYKAVLATPYWDIWGYLTAEHHMAFWQITESD